MRVQDHIDRFGLVAGQLAVGGIPIERLAARVGATPFFAYDRDLIDKRISFLRACLPERIDLGYAVKANPMPAVVHCVAGRVDALDVASSGEMKVALDAGMSPDRVSFAGPGKTRSELSMAVASGIIVEVESAGEVGRLVEVAEELGVRPTAAVRVNPDFSVLGSGMRMGGGPQQFGVDAEQVPRLVDDMTARGIDVAGFHVFAGSQNLQSAILVKAQQRTVELVLRLAEESSCSPRYLNLGGGFGIPYFDKDEPLDLAPIGENLAALVDGSISPVFPDTRIQIELGRYLVGEAGVYVTRVVDRKESRGRVYVVVDGGMHHQLAASGNLGQVIRRNYPIAIASNAAAEPAEEVSVVGCLCTPLDLLGDRVALPECEVGDLVAVFQAGAYGLSASPRDFLMHPDPVEVLV